MNEKVRKFQARVLRYFNPVPKELRASFSTAVARENFLRLIPISMVYLLLNTNLSVFGRRQIPREINLRNYIAVFLILFCLFAILRLRTMAHQARWYDHAMTSTFCFVMVFATLIASQIMLVRIGSMSFFTVTILATSAFLIRRPLVVLMTNLSAFLYFTATIDELTNLTRYIESMYSLRQTWLTQATRFEIYTSELALICVVSTIISVVVYRFRAKVFMDHKIIEEKNINLMALTMQDSMTKLLNHKAINELLDQEIQRTLRYNLSLSILLLDIDHFKSVNDTYGHQAGDEVIIKVADILKRICRETDHIGRYGGEEFLVILTNTNAIQAKVFAERVRNQIENSDFGLPRPVTVSGGFCTHSDESGKALIHKADTALYEAKRTGRNKVVQH